MMNTDQIKVVARVFRQFLASETLEWNFQLDDALCQLEWLEDEQLALEATLLCKQHSNNKLRCTADHKRSEECFALTIYDAANSICDLYADTHEMHKNNRYILQYYIALTHLGMILTESDGNNPKRS